MTNENMSKGRDRSRAGALEVQRGSGRRRAAGGLGSRHFPRRQDVLSEQGHRHHAVEPAEGAGDPERLGDRRRRRERPWGEPRARGLAAARRRRRVPAARLDSSRRGLSKSAPRSFRSTSAFEKQLRHMRGRTGIWARPAELQRDRRTGRRTSRPTGTCANCFPRCFADRTRSHRTGRRTSRPTGTSCAI